VAAELGPARPFHDNRCFRFQFKYHVRLKFAIFLLLVPVSVLAQTTPNLNLNIPIAGTSNWGVPLLNANFSMLDSYLSGQTSLPGLSIAAFGRFTNTQQNENLYSAVGGINPATWNTGIFGPGGYSTNALSGGILVPSTATVGGTNGVVGYVYDECGGVEPNFVKCNATGAQGLVVVPNGIGGVNGAALYGVNGLVQDSPDGLSTNSTLEASEFDINLYGTAYRALGFLINGAGTGTMPSAIPLGTTGTISGAAAMYVMSGQTQTDSATNWIWPEGLGFGRAAVNGPAIQIDGTCVTTAYPCSSATMTQTGYDNTGAAHTVSYKSDTIGDMVLTPDSDFGGGPSNVIIGLGHLNPANTGQFTGHCTMVSSTSCTFTISFPYANAACVASVQGTTAIASACSISSTTVTITAASSNSQKWEAILIGDPN
jgi:hypothetical protein